MDGRVIEPHSRAKTAVTVSMAAVTNPRGIAVGPTEYQRRVAGFRVTTFDTDRHVRLKEKGRGAGW
jgi:hypothetical protein